MFYPQLVAGPIERPQHLLHQFYEKHYFEYQRVTDGLKLMVWGVFKKAVIADRVAVLVKHVYADPHDHTGLALIIATVFFAFQIYCDFSGYSDIAIGSAQVMGFKLMDNFNRPYFSKSISEFWKRWHISLSTWFRDYVYIPMGGNRVSEMRHYLNLMVTFILSGLWHGANWTFIVWGGINGFYMIFALYTKKIRGNIVNAIGLDRNRLLQKIVKTVITFGLVCFAWIFFRAESMSDASYICIHLFSGLGQDFINLVKGDFGPISEQILGLGLSVPEIMIAVCAIIFLVFIHFIQKHGSIRHMLLDKPLLLRLSLYYFVVMAIIVFGVKTSEAFIYFQF